MTETENRRAELKHRIETSREGFNAARSTARNAVDGYVDTAREHPIAMIAGGIAIGLIAGLFLPRGAARRAGRAALAAAAVAGELGQRYGRNAVDMAGEAGRDGRHKLGEISETAGEYGRRAAATASNQARRGRDLSGRVVNEALRIASKLRH